RSTPLPDKVKKAWLTDSSCGSRQYLLPFLRPLARTSIVLIQILKVLLPRNWAHSRLLHRLLAFSMNRFASPEHLVMLNNKHPLVPLSTLRAGHRLVLHGLSTEMLHCLLMKVASGDIPLPARELARMREAARAHGSGSSGSSGSANNADSTAAV
ncbi:MAG: hypothetical protein J0H24_01130, partial [Delftia acidovorans]|nr:hypothetical protein [Delftia acidovorans]